MATGVDNLLAALSVKIAGDTQDFEKALARTQNKLKDFGNEVNTNLARTFESIDMQSKKLEKGIGRMGESMQSAGKAMTVGLSLPLIALGARAVKSAADFEQMSNVLQAQSQASAKEMALVSEKAKQLGADIKLPGTSAKDALTAITELSKGGLTLAQAMDSARGSLELSAAAQISNAQAAEIQVNALSAFNLQASEAGRVADLLAGAANQSSSSIQDIAQGFAAGASEAKRAKLSILEYTTALAIMSNAGIKGSDAGTSIKSMLMALQSPSAKAAEKMREIGISIFDAQGQMKPFPQIIADFNGALKGLTDKQKNDIMGTIFTADSIRAANIIFTKGPQGFADLAGAVGRAGQAAQMAEAQNKGFYGAIDGLMSTIDTFLTNEASPFLEVFKDITNAVRGVIEKLNSLPGSTQKVIAIFAATTAILGPLLLAVGSIIAAIPALTAGLTAIGAAFSTALGPISVLVAALGAIAFVIYKNWEPISAFFSKLWSDVKTIFVNSVNGLITTVAGLITGTIGLFKGVLEKLGIGESLQKTLAGASNTVTEFADSIKLSAEDTKKSVIGLGNELAKVKKTAAEPVVASTDTGTGGGKTVILTEEQQKALDKYRQDLQSLINQHQLFGESFNFIGEKAELLEKSLVDLMDAGFKPQSTFIQGLKKEFDSLNKTLEKNKELFGSIQAIAKVPEKPKAPEAPTHLLPQDTPVVPGQKPTKLSELNPEQLKELGLVSVNVSAQVQDAMASMAIGVAESLGNMFSGVTNVGDGLKNIFTGLLGTVVEFMGNFGKALIQAGTAAVAFANLALAPGAGIAAGLALVIASQTLKGLLSKGLQGGGIPALADGGITQRATLALIGEAGREAVIPLDRLDEFMGGGNRAMEVTVKGEIAGDVIRLINNQANKHHYRTS